MIPSATFIRRDLLVLGVYLSVVVLVQLLETRFSLSTTAMAVYLAASAAYVVSIALMHRRGNRSDLDPDKGLQFIGIFVSFIVFGLALGLVIGVNAKFLLGGKL